MPLEPGGFQLTSGHFAGHDDLEGALAQGNCGWVELVAAGVAVAEIMVSDAVQGIAAPVEFFLQGDHAAQQGCGLVFVGIESGTGQREMFCQLPGQVRLPLLSQAIQGSGEVQGFVCRNGNFCNPVPVNS